MLIKLIFFVFHLLAALLGLFLMSSIFFPIIQAEVHIIGWVTHGIISLAGLLILLCVILSIIEKVKWVREKRKWS